MPAAKEPVIHRCPKGAIDIEYESVSGKGRGVWFARVPSEHTIEDVLSPAYFGLMQSENQQGKVMRTGDVIEIEPENARWCVRARVMGLRWHTQQVLLREQQRWDFAVKPQPGYDFVWDGNDACWAIYKGKTKVDSGYSTETECFEAVEELKREKVA